jgi:hypothetical protein
MYVTLPPARMLIVLLMLPVPLAGHEEPAEALHVHVTPVN